MDEDLQRLTDTLRHQICPPDVIERVMQGIGRDQAQRRGCQWRYAWAMAGLALIVTLSTWQVQVRREHRARADRVRVIQQTEGALAYVGHTLLQAAARAEDTLSKQAMPPLRNSLETTKNKLMNRI
jgi:hypothetical protein